MESTIGGTRRHLVDVARGQRRSGLEVTVVASAERQADVRVDFETLREEGCSVIELGMVRSIQPSVDVRHVKALESILRTQKPDVVHTHSSKAGALGRWASIRSGIGRRVHTPHTFAFLFDAMFGRVKRRIFRGVEVSLAKRTDRVVAVSESEAETIERSGVVPAGRLSTVTNGIDSAPWLAARPMERAALGVPEGVPLFAVVGLLNPAKGQDVAIRALARMVSPAAGEPHLLIVGHGEGEAELRALASDVGVAERVRFLGWRQDVPALLATADCLVLPSRWEGLPYIVLEAFAAGLPVVATAVDGVAELLQPEGNGLVVPIADDAALAGALGRVASMTPDERSAWGAYGRARVVERYSIESMVSGLTHVYSEVLA